MTRIPLHLIFRLPSLYVFVFFFLSYDHAFCQRPVYTIQASLDTGRHVLTGDIRIQYTNQSNHSLDSLGIHLWPNAYQNNSTALAKQLLRNGNTDMHFANARDFGRLAGLDFRMNRQPLLLVSDPVHEDMAWLHLPYTLEPGDSIEFSSPFVLDIPASFSRLGHTPDGAYQLTQWYPRVAVVDDEGWHMMPYLDHGEFFNDFADYAIHIRTPDNLMVAASGPLTTSITSNGWTAWTFHASHVIDFAWFASPLWKVDSGRVDIGSQVPVMLKVYTDTIRDKGWSRAYTYAARALQFYSDWLGPYPYPQMTIVSTPFSQAGYMEYPMLAQISYTSDTALLDIAIAHEVGHTWLYGVLANNERAHPWMDEGLTTFLEEQYAAQYQPDYKDGYLPGVLRHRKSMKEVDAMKHWMQFNSSLQPPAMPPEFQDRNQYYFSAYHLPAIGLNIMQRMVGHEKMKKMFRAYFNQHHLTHVTPSDLKQSFESACACRLDWFFDTWISGAHEVDYRIRKFDRKHKDVTVENRSGVVVPLKITAYQDGHQVLRHWIPGFSGKKIFHLDRFADEVRLYEDVMMVNGRWRSNFKPRASWPAFTPWPMISRYDRPQISLTPMAGYTIADGLMPGVVLTSGLIPQQNWKIFLAPLYSLDSKSFRGAGEIRHVRPVRKGVFDMFLLSLSGSHFAYHADTHYLFRDTYKRLSPEIGFRLRSSGPWPRPVQWWRYRIVGISQSYGQGISYQDYTYARHDRQYAIHELSWQLKQESGLGTIQAIINVQAGRNFLRVNSRYAQHFAGKHKGRGVWIRGFAGWLPVFNQPDAYVPFTINGLSSNGFFSSDYMYDEWLGGRNADRGLFAHQVFDKDAHLKTLATFGFSDKWMIGSGVSLALPLKYFHVYTDAAYYPSRITGQTELTYSGGIAIVLMKDVFEIYIPLLESKDIRNSLTYEVRDRWFDRISFQANFKFFHPLNLVDRFQLGL